MGIPIHVLVRRHLYIETTPSCVCNVYISSQKTNGHKLSSALYCTAGKRAWASYQIHQIVGCACAVNAGNVFPGNCSIMLNGSSSGSAIKLPQVMGRAGHYSDVIMGAMASQITRLTIVYPTIYSCADQRKHQSSASLAFVRGIHRWSVNSPHKWPVTRKMFSFGDVIMHDLGLVGKVPNLPHKILTILPHPNCFHFPTFPAP